MDTPSGQQVLTIDGGLLVNAEVRVLTIDGEPWFVAKDVCDVLGLQTNNLRRDLDAEEVAEANLSTGEVHSGGRKPLVINESGLYSLILRSRKPQAKAFKKWVTSVVLPTIRKTGGAYIAPGSRAELDLSDPATALATIKQAVAIAEEAQSKKPRTDESVRGL